MMKVTGRLVVIAAAAGLLAGCATQSSPPPAGQVPGAATTSTPAATVPTGTQVLEDAPAILADGRHPVYLKTIDVAGSKITFDLIVFLTGAEAEAQWIKDHNGQTPEALNGYYIINNNTKLRTLPVSAGVVVTTVEGDPGNPKTLAFKDLPSFPAVSQTPFWITVVKGEITLVEQQFIP